MSETKNATIDDIIDVMKADYFIKDNLERYI